MGMHVPPYKEGSFSNDDPNRPRKLLLTANRSNI